MIVLLEHGSEVSQKFEIDLKRFQIRYEVNIIKGTVSCKLYDEYIIDEKYNKIVCTLIP